MIGIFAPFRNCQETHMALGLASFAIRLGHNVTWFNPEDVKHNVDPVWYKKVKSDRDVFFSDWTANCSHIAWFSLPIGRLSIARLRGCRNTLVAITKAYDHSIFQDKFLSLDYVIVPSVTCHAQLKQSALHAASRTISDDALDVCLDKIQPVPWDTCNSFLSKRKTQVNNAFVLLTKTVVTAYGCHVLDAVACLLEELNTYKVTIAINNKLLKPIEARLKVIIDRFKDNIAIVPEPGYSALPATVSQHDWLFYPSSDDDVCLPAISALYSGTPVIGLAVPPMIEIVTTEPNMGHLIPCNIEQSKWERLNTVTKPTRQQLADGLVSCIANPDKRLAAVNSDWYRLKTRRETFHKVWDCIWSEEPRHSSK